MRTSARETDTPSAYRRSAAPVAAEFASVRVVATDAAGNRLTQLIAQAWRIDAPR